MNTSEDIKAEFNRLDVNKDGYVCISDMVSSSVSRSEAEDIIDAYDFDRDEKLNLKEFVAMVEDEDDDDSIGSDWDADDSDDDPEMWHKMSAEYDNMKDESSNESSPSPSCWHDSDDDEMFDSVDLDGNGRVSSHDMAGYFQMDIHEAKRIIAAFDIDGDGYLNHREFAKFDHLDISASSDDEKGEDEENESSSSSSEDVFDDLDFNGDGKITPTDYMYAMHELGDSSVTISDAETFVKSVSSDGLSISRSDWQKSIDEDETKSSDSDDATNPWISTSTDEEFEKEDDLGFPKLTISKSEEVISKGWKGNPLPSTPRQLQHRKRKLKAHKRRKRQRHRKNHQKYKQKFRQQQRRRKLPAPSTTGAWGTQRPATTTTGAWGRRGPSMAQRLRASQATRPRNRDLLLRIRLQLHDLP